MDPIQYFKCMADDTRLRCLLAIVVEQELCVCELTAALQLSQPKVSRHLALLRESELLLDRKQGQWVFYRLNPALPKWLQSVIEQTASANKVFMKDTMQRLSQMGDRPERVLQCC